MASRPSVRDSFEVKSDPAEALKVCEQILSKLQCNNFGRDDVFAVHLALEEALLNAMKHGNKMDPQRKVKVEYSANGDKVEITVTDQGEGFKPGLIPDPRIAQNLLKPEGRGLFLINSYMDVVEFNDSGNSVRMVRYREKPALMQDSGEQ